MKFEIHLIHHFDSATLAVFEWFIHGLEKRMSQIADDLKALTAKMNDATNALADELTTLKALVKNGMTDAEVAEVEAGLQAVADKLTGLASDPNNPVPVPAPVTDPTTDSPATT